MIKAAPLSPEGTFHDGAFYSATAIIKNKILS